MWVWGGALGLRRHHMRVVLMCGRVTHQQQSTKYIDQPYHPSTHLSGLYTSSWYTSSASSTTRLAAHQPTRRLTASAGRHWPVGLPGLMNTKALQACAQRGWVGVSTTG